MPFCVIGTEMQERPYAGLADASPASSLQTMILARRVEHAFNVGG